jgi:hypothetical protein
MTGVGYVLDAGEVAEVFFHVFPAAQVSLVGPAGGRGEARVSFPGQDNQAFQQQTADAKTGGGGAGAGLDDAIEDLQESPLPAGSCDNRGREAGFFSAAAGQQAR